LNPRTKRCESACKCPGGYPDASTSFIYSRVYVIS
jgi:hypothetical protein